MNTTVPLLMWNVGAELGLDGLDRVEGELVERDEQPEDHEHRDAALGERLFEVDGFGVDPREEVVGEDDLFSRPSLRFLAGGFLVEHGRGQRRGAALGLSQLVHIGHVFSPNRRCTESAGGWSDGTR